VSGARGRGSDAPRPALRIGELPVEEQHKVTDEFISIRKSAGWGDHAVDRQLEEPYWMGILADCTLLQAPAGMSW
jgi:hypothetical protein